MKAIVIHAAHDLQIEERETREPGIGEVLIDVVAGGICGSDLHYYHQGGFGPIRLREPMILGHEVAGRVAALGPEVAGLAIGQLVAISPSRPCNSCKFCLEGRQNHCLNMRFYGSAMPFPHIQGAFRQRLVALASQCAPADGLSAGEAAMAEPLAVALHAVNTAGPLLGKSVLITGCGPIGALCAIAARRAGAEKITAVDISDFTLDMVHKVGADEAINTARTPNALQRYQADKGQFDVLFECSGVEQALRGAIDCLRPQGTIVQLGLGGDMNLPMQAITAKELQIKGSFRFHEEFFTCVALMQKGLLDTRPLITHSIPFEDAVAAFEVAGDRTQAMKAQLQFI